MTFAQRMEALFAASELFHLEMCIWENLTPEQSRTRMFVCRHFPMVEELKAVAQRESAFVRRAKDAIDRTIANDDGVPAETIVNKLESKLTAARKARLS